MKVLCVIGSPRKGNTHRVCEDLAAKVREYNPSVSFDYLMLQDAHVEMCRGCQVCLLRGVEKCPLKDDIPTIVDRLNRAEGYILASPGYNQQVPGLMKNFIDRMSFNCHSPSLYGKRALTITTVGGMGAKPTLNYLTLIATCWGGHVVGSLSVLMDYVNHVPGHKEKAQKRIARMARSYAAALNSTDKPVPNFRDLLVFAALREETRFSPHFREHWEKMGWAHSDYYYEANIPVLRQLAARMMGFIIKKEMDAVFKHADTDLR